MSSSTNVLLAGALGAVCGAAAVSMLRPQPSVSVPAAEPEPIVVEEKLEIEESSADTTETGVGSEHPGAKNAEYNNCIYLDCNATTPIYPEVADKMWPYAHQYFGNPSSGHIFGRPCKRSLQESRDAVAALLRAGPHARIVFTGCGSESDNRAIDIAIDLHRRKEKSESKDSATVPHIVSSVIEHPAILAYLRALEAQGEIKIDLVPVNGAGLIRVADVLSVLRPETVLVTIMHSNNEIGTIQPISDITAAVKKSRPDVLMHTDAAQSTGKTDVNVQALGVDLLTLVGHKYGAPKGIAVLFIKEGVEVPRPMLVGGGQEGGLRAGTENMLHIVAIGEASRIATRELVSVIRHYITLRKIMIRQLIALDQQMRRDLQLHEQPFVQFNGPREVYDLKVLDAALESEEEALRLSNISLLNTVSVSFRGQSGHSMVAALGDKLIACSAGSACFTAPADGIACAKTSVMSHVLSACGIVPEFGLGTLRLSTGRHTTIQDVESAAVILFIKLAMGN